MRKKQWDEWRHSKEDISIDDIIKTLRRLENKLSSKQKETKNIFYFKLTHEEEEKLNKWNDIHKEVCTITDEGAIGGRITFEFTPTGLGDVVKVRCACGAKIDLTEYEKW